MPVNQTEPRRVYGPNMKKLISLLAAGLAAKSGAKTPGDYITILKDNKRHIALTKLTITIADQAIEAMRKAPDNTWGSDEEVLAGVILSKMEERGAADPS